MKALGKAVLFVLVAIALNQECEAADQCLGLWRSTGQLHEELRNLYPTGQIPGEQPIQNVKIKELTYPDGKQFVPETLVQSDCYLDRILPAAIKRALRQSAVEARSRDNTVDGRYEAFIDKVDAKVVDVNHDDAKISVMAALKGYLVESYNIAGLQDSEPTKLEYEMFAKGVYFEPRIMAAILLHYLKHLGADIGYDRFIRQARRDGAADAPPLTLKPQGCQKTGIRYSWPTISAPLDTFKDLDSAVHWGVCNDDESLWVYSYGKGWAKVDNVERIEFCNGAVGEQQQFDSICRVGR